MVAGVDLNLRPSGYMTSYQTAPPRDNIFLEILNDIKYY